jgi:prepilin-type N-terminal cleavage/methylation domain-containing protein
MKGFTGHFNNQKGFTLVEVLISMLILSTIITCLCMSLVVSSKTSLNNKYNMTSINLANESMEYIRSLQFVEVGTVGGDPAGVILQTKTENVNGIDYKISTTVNWEEEGDWDVSGNADWDYKSVRVEVVPQGMEGIPSLTKVIETFVTRDSAQPPLTGGNIRLRLVKGSDTDILIPNAKIRLTTGPSAPRQVMTSSQGTVRFINLLPGNYSVQIDPSNLGMILRPDQPGMWDISVASYITQTKEFLVDYPCRIKLTLKELTGNSISMNPGISGRIYLEDPYGTVTVKDFTPAELDSMGRLPDSFLSNLWPFDNRDTSAYKIPNVTISGYLFFGSNDVTPTGEVPWNGQFTGPGTNKNIICYFRPFPVTPADINTAWVNGSDQIKIGTYKAEDEHGTMTEGRFKSNDLSETVQMPSDKTTNYTAKAIYFDNTGTSGIASLSINNKSNLILNTDLVVIRGGVSITSNRRTSYIGKITLNTLDGSASSAVDGRYIGGTSGVSYGKLYLAKEIKLGEDTIVEPGGYYYYDGLVLPNNASRLIPITKNNYLE